MIFCKTKVATAIGLFLSASMVAKTVEAQSVCEFYLHDDGSFDENDATDFLGSLPPTGILPTPPDFDSDGNPGLTIKKEPKDNDPKHYQEWVHTAQPESMCFSGLAHVTLYAAEKDFELSLSNAFIRKILTLKDSENSQSLLGLFDSIW